MSVSNIHVIGDSFIAPLVAITLARKIPQIRENISVTLCQPKHYGTISTFSDFKKFQDYLGLDEKIFMKGTQATFNQSAHIISSNSSGLFSDSEYGVMIKNAAFHQLFDRLRKRHPNISIEDFCLATALAKRNKFLPSNPSIQTLPQSLSYGFNFSEAQYCALLKTLAEAIGIPFSLSKSVDIELSEQGIKGLRLEGGRDITADLYIDCTEDGMIANKLDDNKIELANLPYWDLNIQERQSISEAPPSIFSLKLNHSEGTIFKDTVLRYTQHRKSFDFTPDANQHKAQTKQKAWVKNCIAIGCAFAKLPNLIIDRHYLAQNQLIQLIDISPSAKTGDGAKNTFNARSRQVANYLGDIDNLLVHKLIPERTPLTDKNRVRIELYQFNGSLHQTESGIIPDSQWPILFSLLGYTQVGNDTFSSKIGIDEIERQLSGMHRLIQQIADAAPNHNDWLKQIGI